MDAYLVRLAQAAEAGEQCPHLKLLIGIQLASGIPKPSRHVYETMQAEVSWQKRPLAQPQVPSDAKLGEKMAFGFNKAFRPAVVPRKADPAQVEAAEAAVEEELKPLWDALRREDPEGTPTALTLVPGELIFADGSGARIPALRVPIEAVDAWWIAAATRTTEAPTSFFVGGLLPIGN